MTYPIAPLDLIAVGPPLGFRFSVVFLTAGVAPNPIDLRFKSVSGLGSTVQTRNLDEGGQNLFTRHIPERVQYENLVLDRGLLLSSPLADEFNLTMSTFRFVPCNVLVSLLDEGGKPITSWLFMVAYPVKWTIAKLDAGENQVVIETMELTYQRMQSLRI